MRVLMLGIVIAVAALMPASASAEDQQIADFIKARLMQEKQQGNLFGFNVDMRVDRGTVWFKGFVSNRSQELLILRTAQLAGHLGVVQVVDDIEINNPTGNPAQTQQQAMQQQQPYQMPNQANQAPDRMAMRPGQPQLPVSNQQQMQQAQQQIQVQQNIQREMMQRQMLQRQAMPQPPMAQQPLGPQSLAPQGLAPQGLSPQSLAPQIQRSALPAQTPAAQLPQPGRMNMPLSDASEPVDPKMPKVDDATQEPKDIAQKVAYQEPIPAAPLNSINRYQGQLPGVGGGVRAQSVAATIAPPNPIATHRVAAAQPLPFARAAAPMAQPGCQDGFCGDTGGYGGGYAGGPGPATAYGGGPGFGGPGGGAGITSDSPSLPGYSWPAYAANPNYGAVSYPKQYSPSAWPYIGPFYPYPQVPLGWRKVSLEWDDGWWFLDFHDKN